MSNFFLTPNMNLVVPVWGVDPGPDWANNLNASLSIVDSHTHNPGSGVQITPGGLNINSDLSFQTNNAINLNSVRFQNLGSALSSSSPNIGCLYQVNGDLYYNDTASHQIRITQSGAVTGATGTITGLPSGTAGAAYSPGTGTFVFSQATSTGANLDVGSLVIRYPGSYPTPSGNYIILEAPTSLASGYSITLPSLPAQTNVMTLGTDGAMSSVTWNAVAQNRTRATGSSVGLGGVAVSGSLSFTTASATPVIITSSSITLTTSGRPVMLGFMPDGNDTIPGNAVLASTASGDTIGQVYFYNGNTVIGVQKMQSVFPSGSNFFVLPASSFNMITFPSSGANTFSAYLSFIEGTGNIQVSHLILYAYEL